MESEMSKCWQEGGRMDKQIQGWEWCTKKKQPGNAIYEIKAQYRFMLQRRKIHARKGSTQGEKEMSRLVNLLHKDIL